MVGQQQPRRHEMKIDLAVDPWSLQRSAVFSEEQATVILQLFKATENSCFIAVSDCRPALVDTGFPQPMAR